MSYGKRVQQPPPRPAKKRRRKKSFFGRLYTFLVVVSVLIIALFCGYKYMTVLPDIPSADGILSGLASGLTGGAGKDTDGDGQISADEQTLPAVSDSDRKEGFYTFLLFGTDHGNGGSDTIMAVSFDTANNKVNVMSIPRDTLVDVSWTTKKINSTFNVGGEELLEQTVEGILGIPIDYYVKVDLNGFIDAVDAIGGVWFDVPRDMDYDDPYQDLHIHVKAGYQCLNGTDAMGVVRWRHNNDYSQQYIRSDFDRVETQQAFLKAFAKQLLSAENLLSAGKLVSIFNESVETDMPARTVTAFMNAALGLSTDDITCTTIPTEADTIDYKGRNYVELIPWQVRDVVNQQFNPYLTDRTLDDLHILAPSPKTKEPTA